MRSRPSQGGSSCSKHKNKLRLITHCPFTGQAICKCSTRLHLLRPREKMIPAFAKAPPFSHKTMHGELQCDVYSISYVLLHKKRLLCLRRFLIIMRRTNISNFSFLISHSKVAHPCELNPNHFKSRMHNPCIRLFACFLISFSILLF